MTNVETRLSSQLNKREQEIIALQARMQASYQDHVAQTQALNAKVCTSMSKGGIEFLIVLLDDKIAGFPPLFLTWRILQVISLQDQLEKGPNAQLARLQQENSILRDALNQATSQAESKSVPSSSFFFLPMV